MGARGRAWLASARSLGGPRPEQRGPNLRRRAPELAGACAQAADEHSPLRAGLAPQLDALQLAQMCAMGFPRAHAQHALAATGCSGALTLILTQSQHALAATGCSGAARPPLSRKGHGPLHRVQCSVRGTCGRAARSPRRPQHASAALRVPCRTGVLCCSLDDARCWIRPAAPARVRHDGVRDPRQLQRRQLQETHTGCRLRARAGVDAAIAWLLPRQGDPALDALPPAHVPQARQPAESPAGPPAQAAAFTPGVAGILLREQAQAAAQEQCASRLGMLIRVLVRTISRSPWWTQPPCVAPAGCQGCV